MRNYYFYYMIMFNVLCNDKKLFTYVFKRINMKKKRVKIPNCYNNEAWPSRGTKRSYKEQIRTKQNSHMKLLTRTKKNYKRGTALERPVDKLVGVGVGGGQGGGGGLKLVFLARNFPLNSDAAPNYGHITKHAYIILIRGNYQKLIDAG